MVWASARETVEFPSNHQFRRCSKREGTLSITLKITYTHRPTCYPKIDGLFGYLIFITGAKYLHIQCGFLYRAVEGMKGYY